MNSSKLFDIKAGLCLLLAIASFFVKLDGAFAQKVHFDVDKWVEYIEGDMPLVISVPHGGKLTSDTLPVRTCKDAITGPDGNTIELARAFQKEFKKKYGLTPHIIISHIARKHVDQNREFENGATCGNDVMDKGWYSFHNFVDTAIKIAEKKYKKVVYIDLHGHGHRNHRLELGYTLRWGALQAIAEDNYQHIKATQQSSVQNLLAANPKITLRDLMIGENAFGTLIANYGIPATPSKQDLYPKQGEEFFSRGDNTTRFTGPSYPNVFGFQLECDRTIRKEENHYRFAAAFVPAILKYIEEFAGVKPKDMK